MKGEKNKMEHIEQFKKNFIEVATRDLKPGFDFGEVFDIFIRELIIRLGEGFIEFTNEKLKENINNLEEQNDATIQSNGPQEVERILGDGEGKDNKTGESNISDGKESGEQSNVGVEENEKTDNNPERDDGEEEIGNNGEEIRKINPEPDDEFDDPNFPPEPQDEAEYLAE